MSVGTADRAALEYQDDERVGPAAAQRSNTPLVVSGAVAAVLLGAAVGTGYWVYAAAAVAAVGAAVLTITVLTVAGLRAHWVPAVETEPLPAEVVGATAGPVYEGSRLFYDKGCQYCHVVAGRGGTFGPDLTDVAQRLPAKEITMRIVAGIGYMPAYRDELTPQELEAIVAFLQALPEIDAGAAGPAGATGDRGVRR